MLHIDPDPQILKLLQAGDEVGVRAILAEWNDERLETAIRAAQKLTKLKIKYADVMLRLAEETREARLQSKGHQS